MDLSETGCEDVMNWTEFNVESSGGLLWTWWWNFGVHERKEISL